MVSPGVRIARSNLDSLLSSHFERPLYAGQVRQVERLDPLQSRRLQVNVHCQQEDDLSHLLGALETTEAPREAMALFVRSGGC